MEKCRAVLKTPTVRNGGRRYGKSTRQFGSVNEGEAVVSYFYERRRSRSERKETTAKPCYFCCVTLVADTSPAGFL
jgi:hypothetical protein